ncbi:MAG: type pilus assembly protein PilB, partial [Candidatus Hydrogenedentes bacterium]|nr:type pilus assembly protein PilB [Candidatus Hydrogenedentota bacterium]
KAVQKLTDAHIEIERLNRQLAARDASVADYAKRVAELDEAQQDFDRQVRTLRKEQDAAKAGQAETLERCRQLEETLAARDSALRAQTNRTTEIEQCARELQQTVEQLRREKVEVGTQLVEVRATTEQFQQNLSARNQQAEADTRHIAELEQNLDRIRVELETSRLQRESEARELADARSEIARLQQRLAAHSTKALTDDGRVGELTQTMDRLSDESESLRAENNRMARDLADATAQIASLKQALSSATSGEAIERIQAELDTVKSEGRRAAGRVREADAKTKQIEQRLTQVQTELRDARALNESLQEELDEAHGGGTSSVSELREALIEIESLKDMLAERDRTALAATQHIVQLGQTVTRLENELNTIRSQEGNAGEIAAQLKAARADNETKLKALALAQAEMQSLSEALARSRESGASGEELAKTLHKYAELQEQARVLQETNRKLQQRVDGVEDDKKTRRRQNRIALEALDSQGRSRKMGEILHAAGVITEEQLKDALGEQKAMPDRLLGTILLEKGYVDEHDIAQVVSSQLQVPFMPLYPETVGPEAAGLLDGKFCMWHMCVPLRATSELLVVAMANPLDSAALEKIESASTRRVVPVVATPSDITVIIETLFGSY